MSALSKLGRFAGARDGTRLRVAGAAALALALQFAGSVSATAAGYSKSCERPTGKSKVGCLMKPVSVPVPGAGGVLTLRSIYFNAGADPGAAKKLGIKDTETRWGMADANGATLVVPRYYGLERLSGTAALVELDEPGRKFAIVNIAADTAAALPFTEVNRYRRDGFSVVFGVAAKHPDGREDWRHVAMDGTLGRSLEGVVNLQPAYEDRFRVGGMQAGPFIIVNQSPKGDGKVYSNWMDITGATVFTGLAASRFGDKMMIRVGDTPLPFDKRDTGAYVPVDDKGRPVLPDSVAAVAPIFLEPPGFSGGVRGWGLVMKNGEYRFGQGQVDAVLADPSKAMLLEDITWAAPSVRERDNIERASHLLAIRPKGRAWMLGGSNGLQPTAEFATAVEAANSPTVARNTMEDNRRAKVQAFAAASAAEQARRRAEAKANFASGRDTSRSNAMIAGDDESAAWLQRNRISTFGLASDTTDVGQWCAVGPKACGVAKAQLQAMQNDRAAQIAERTAVDAAFKAFAAPRGASDVNVTIYEGGRVRTEVWSRGHFERMTAK